MRILDKFISFVFSIVIIVLAMTVVLVSFNVVNYAVIEGVLTNYVFNDLYKLTVVLVSVLFMLAGLKVTVFSSSLSSGGRKNIYVNTPNGKIQIAQETIEGIAKNVISNYGEVKEVKAAMTKVKKGINLYMGLLVYQNTNITNIVTRIQDEVKKQIEDTTGVRVYNVDVRVRNVVSISTTEPKKSMGEEMKKQENVELNRQQAIDDKVDVIEQQKLESREDNVKSAVEYSNDADGVLYKAEPNNNENDSVK